MNTQSTLGFQQSDGSELMPEVINGKVDARSVHEALQVKSQFNEWINRRINDFGFLEGEDYHRNFDSSPLRKNRIDFDLTLDMAKELAMVERNEMGRKMRRYFIECEKKLVSTQPPALEGGNSTMLKLAELNSHIIGELGSQSQRIAELESQVAAGEDFMAIAQFLEERFSLKLSPQRISYLSRCCLQSSAIHRQPVGEERHKHTRRRIFSPSVLNSILPPIIKRWEAAGKISTQKVGGAA